MINIYNADNNIAVLDKAIRQTLLKFDIDESDIEVEVELLSAEEIKDLNREQRGIDSATDVLSFPALEVSLPFNKSDYPDDIDPECDAVILGEIYICLQIAAEQAEEYNHSLTRELGFLVTHGMLHLLGYDHVDDAEREEMEDLQTQILDAAGISRNIKDGDIKEEKAAAITDTAAKDSEELIKTGYVALLGRPNSGKSTLINTLVGEKVAIVSWKPQTTRNRILGIMNEADAQVVFVDTPGLHAPQNALGKFMMRSVTSALEGVDIVIYVVDGEKGVDKNDIANINRYIEESQKKVIIVVNKIDHITREKVGEMLSILSGIEKASAIVPISALRQKNIVALKQEVIKLLGYGKKEYDDDTYTDKSMRFMAAEIIREKALRLLDKEVPYGVGVAINKYEYNEKGIIEIDADIICQKTAHKPIILGKGGDMIKKIGTYARQDLETMTGSKIFLTLWVRVKEDWRDNANILDELGYSKDNY